MGVWGWGIDPHFYSKEWKLIRLSPHFNNVQNLSYIEYILSRQDCVEVTSVLARQGQATRGHTVKDSNFIQILNLLRKDNQILDSWLIRKRKQKAMTFKTKSCSMMAHTVLCQIVANALQSKFIDLIADEATARQRWQAAIVCLYSVGRHGSRYTRRLHWTLWSKHCCQQWEPRRKWSWMLFF